MERNKLDRSVIISCYRESLMYFEEEGRCDVCNLDLTPVKQIITWNEDDELESDTRYCFRCYKDMMGKCGEDLEKSFRPEWVLDCLQKPNVWINAKEV